MQILSNPISTLNVAYANRRNIRDLLEIGVDEHDGDVRF